jgi:hypothetical protein
MARLRRADTGRETCWHWLKPVQRRLSDAGRPQKTMVCPTSEEQVGRPSGDLWYRTQVGDLCHRGTKCPSSRARAGAEMTQGGAVTAHRVRLFMVFTLCVMKGRL